MHWQASDGSLTSPQLPLDGRHTPSLQKALGHWTGAYTQPESGSHDAVWHGVGAVHTTSTRSQSPVVRLQLYEVHDVLVAHTTDGTLTHAPLTHVSSVHLLLSSHSVAMADAFLGAVPQPVLLLHVGTLQMSDVEHTIGTYSHPPVARLHESLVHADWSLHTVCSSAAGLDTNVQPACNVHAFCMHWFVELGQNWSKSSESHDDDNELQVKLVHGVLAWQMLVGTFAQ